MLIWFHHGIAWRPAVTFWFVDDVEVVVEATFNTAEETLRITRVDEPEPNMIPTIHAPAELAILLARHRDSSIVVYPAPEGHRHGCPIVFAPGNHPPMRIGTDDPTAAEAACDATH